MQAAAGTADSGNDAAGSFSGDTVEGVVCQLAEQDIGRVNGMQTSCMARVRSVQQVTVGIWQAYRRYALGTRW